eukprot:3653603-Prymnesium_polylepis.1
MQRAAWTAAVDALAGGGRRPSSRHAIAYVWPAISIGSARHGSPLSTPPPISDGRAPHSLAISGPPPVDACALVSRASAAAEGACSVSVTSSYTCVSGGWSACAAAALDDGLRVCCGSAGGGDGSAAVAALEKRPAA